MSTPVISKNANKRKKRPRERSPPERNKCVRLSNSTEDIQSPVAANIQHNIFVGTSGYSYPSWHRMGSFYPKGTRGKELQFYMNQFNSLELNYTHYRIPPEKSWIGWKEKAGLFKPNFAFIIKVNMWFTHMKLLRVDQAFREKWETFWTLCKLLGANLGPLLFQFPARFKYTPEKGLDNFHKLGSLLPPDGKYAFEFRDESWYCPEVYQLFRERDWCLCRLHLNNKGAWAGSLSSGHWPPEEVSPEDYSCSWGVYLRYHGTTGQYEGSYGPEYLDTVREIGNKCVAAGKQLYIYFNNTDEGTPPSAIKDALYLSELFELR